MTNIKTISLLLNDEELKTLTQYFENINNSIQNLNLYDSDELEKSTCIFKKIIIEKQPHIEYNNLYNIICKIDVFNKNSNLYYLTYQKYAVYIKFNKNINCILEKDIVNVFTITHLISDEKNYICSIKKQLNLDNYESIYERANGMHLNLNNS